MERQRQRRTKTRKVSNGTKQRNVSVVEVDIESYCFCCTAFFDMFVLVKGRIPALLELQKSVQDFFEPRHPQRCGRFRWTITLHQSHNCSATHQPKGVPASRIWQFEICTAHSHPCIDDS